MLLALAIAFSLFERGTRAFRYADTKVGLASDARRSLILLEPDLRRSDAALSLLEARNAGVYRRDAASFVTLSAWNDPTRFNSLNASIYWDQYAVVYANLQNPGYLIRQVQRPPFVAPDTFYTKSLPWEA